MEISFCGQVLVDKNILPVSRSLNSQYTPVARVALTEPSFFQAILKMAYIKSSFVDHDLNWAWNWKNQSGQKKKNGVSYLGDHHRLSEEMSNWMVHDRAWNT